MNKNNYIGLLKRVQLCIVLILQCIVNVNAQTLPTYIKSALNRYNFPDDSISIYIEQTDNKNEIINWHSDQFKNPASTMKLVTTYAGLDILGPDFTWDTEFYTNSPIPDGTISDEFYIKGSGDPLLISETLEQAIIAIRAKGIHTLSGDLVIDNSYFQVDESYPDSLYGHWLEPYSALPDAANINFGTVEINIVTGKYSSRPDIHMNPPRTRIQVIQQNTIKRG